MSKKDKSKFRKRIKSQLLEEMSRAQSLDKPKTKPVIQPAAATMQPPKQPVSPVATSLPTTPTMPGLKEPLSYIKKDLKKSAIIIGSMMAIIIILTIVDLKTNILLNFGDQIFKVLHIGG